MVARASCEAWIDRALQKEIGSPAHRLPHVFPDDPSLIARAFQTVSQLLEFTDGKAGRKQLCRTNVQLDDLKIRIRSQK